MLFTRDRDDFALAVDSDQPRPARKDGWAIVGSPGLLQGEGGSSRRATPGSATALPTSRCCLGLFNEVFLQAFHELLVGFVAKQ